MMDARIDSFESLLSEVSAAIADVVDTIKDRNSSSDEIASTLADILSAIESRKSTDLSGVVSAIKSIRIDSPNITVSPTPITIEPQITVQPSAVQIIERTQPGTYKMTVKYDNYDRITEAVIKAV